MEVSDIGILYTKEIFYRFFCFLDDVGEPFPGKQKSIVYFPISKTKTNNTTVTKELLQKEIKIDVYEFDWLQSLDLFMYDESSTSD